MNKYCLCKAKRRLKKGELVNSNDVERIGTEKGYIKKLREAITPEDYKKYIIGEFLPDKRKEKNGSNNT